MNYKVKVLWEKDPGEVFSDLRYHRKHTWLFDCGINVPASSSPQVVPVPMSEVNAVDPEEAFIASVSACHMLFFLSISAAKKFVVQSYEDSAEGIMNEKNEGKIFIKEIKLNPCVKFAGAWPSKDQLEELHQLSHDKCYLANSIVSRIVIAPIIGGQ